MERPEPQLDALYRELVLDHYKHPRGREPLPNPDARNEGFNPLCGDEVKLALCFADHAVDGLEVGGRGCSISVASGSMMAELASGKSFSELRRLFEAFKAMMHGKGLAEDVDMGDLEALEGVKQFPVRIKCAMLPWVTLRDALDAWERGGKKRSAASTTEKEDER